MAEVTAEDDGVEMRETSRIIDLRTDPRRETILVEGDVDIVTAPRLHSRLVASLESPAEEVVVDLRDITFIDSSGLGVLVSARQRARSMGTKLKLILPEGQARFPFEVTGLAFLFDTHDPVG